MIVFSCIAPNYKAHAKILFESIEKFHPSWIKIIVICEKNINNFDFSEIPFDYALSLTDLGPVNNSSWSFGLSLVELATAIKPFVFKKLFSLFPNENVVFFDPDIELFSEIYEIEKEFNRGDILLTPHQLSPEQSSYHIVANEICTLQHGIFNLGFIAIKNSAKGKNLLNWWADRVFHYCTEAIATGLYTDQKWLDLAPILFNGVVILKSNRLNVAIWNLSTRLLEHPDNGEKTPYVNGKPLGFFHYSGLHQAEISTYADFEINQPKNQCALHCVNCYKDKLAHIIEKINTPSIWKLGFFADGSPIEEEHRIVYRNRHDLKLEFPDPYNTELKHSFKNWWNKQASIEFPMLFSPLKKEEELTRLRNLLAFKPIE